MNIILSGFMGCGKTTIGKIIARKLDLDFIDTDKLIGTVFEGYRAAQISLLTNGGDVLQTLQERD